MKKFYLTLPIVIAVIVGLSGCSTTSTPMEKDNTSIDITSTISTIEETSTNVEYADVHMENNPLGFSITLAEPNSTTVQEVEERVCHLNLPEDTLLKFQVEGDNGFLEFPICFPKAKEFASKYFDYPGTNNEITLVKTEDQAYTASLISGPKAQTKDHEELITWVSDTLGIQEVNFISQIHIGEKSTFEFISKNPEEAKKQIETANIITKNIANKIDASYVDVAGTLYVTLAASSEATKAEANDILASTIGDRYPTPIVIN